MNLRNKILIIARKILLSKREQIASSSLINMLEKALKYSSINVEVIFEIGANHGQDAKKLQTFYGTSPQNTFLFEPHPVLAAELKNKFKDFRIFELALSDKSGKANFQITPAGSTNDGVSTLGNRILVKGNEKYTSVEVKVSTLDLVMGQLEEIESIDIMKIDVEGFTYEVLKGGEKTFKEKVKCIQIESETVEVFKNQRLYPEIAKLLMGYGFVEMYKEQFVTQNDTVWIHKRFIKGPSEFYNQLS